MAADGQQADPDPTDVTIPLMDGECPFDDDYPDKFSMGEKLALLLVAQWNEAAGTRLWAATPCLSNQRHWHIYQPAVDVAVDWPSSIELDDDPPRPVRAVRLNTISRALEELYGPIPLTVRYRAARAADDIAQEWAQP